MAPDCERQIGECECGATGCPPLCEEVNFTEYTIDPPPINESLPINRHERRKAQAAERRNNG